MESQAKKCHYIPITVFCILSCINLLYVFGADLDTAWNFQIIKAVYNGLLPYKEVSLVQMPGWIYTALPFFWIFGDGFFTEYILNAVILALNSSVLYVNMLKITSSWKKATVWSSIFFVISFPFMVYSYNSMTMLVLLICSYLELNHKNKSPLIGVLYGLPMIMKQSTGIVILLTHIVCRFVFLLKSKDKTKKKYEMKRILFSLVPIVTTIIVILCNGSLHDFVDYTVYGLFAFAQNFKIEFSLNAAGFLLIAVLFGCMFLCSLFKKKLSEEEIVTGFVCFSFLSNLYPLFNPFRLSWCLLVVAPISVCMIKKYRTFDKVFEKMPVFITVLVIQFVAIFLIAKMIPTTLQFTDCKKADGELSGLYITDYNDAVLNAVTQKTIELENEGYDVYYAFASGVIYDITRDEYRKNYDILLYGNIGTTTEEELFNQAVEGKEKVAFFTLYQETTKEAGQEHLAFRKYIMNHCTCIEENLKGGDLYAVYAYEK